MAFTDGLVERRGESVDDGLRRLSSLSNVPSTDLNEWLRKVVDGMEDPNAEDDLAALVIRCTPAHDRLGEQTISIYGSATIDVVEPK